MESPARPGGAMRDLIMLCVSVGIVSYSIWKAYVNRIIAIIEYGPLIHEFDPWFNYRATEYLHENGYAKFFTWFDHDSWYPLGRPVGTTIYPGLQFTGVGLYHALNYFGIPMKLVEVCCYIPAWFGAVATVFTGLITFECSNSVIAGAFGALIMSVVPAHTMRSIGGGFDNETIAVPALCATFYLWTRSLRSDSSWPFAILASMAYFYMVAAWGGYVFVINMIALHAVVLVLLGRFSAKLHRAYTLLYLVGTLAAVQVPVVGWTPIRSLEQIVPLGMFFALHLLMFNESTIKSRGMSPEEAKTFRLKMLAMAGAVLFAAIAVLSPTGLLGPVSMRVRSLFVPHTRTGNPLVDSVAEHQATSPDAYWKNLHYCCLAAPIGLVMLIAGGRKDGNGRGSDAKVFGILYAIVAYYFSNKMNRLIILLGPVASILTGIALGGLVEWGVTTVLTVLQPKPASPVPLANAAAAVSVKKGGKESKKTSKMIKTKDEGISASLYNMVAPIVELVPKEHYLTIQLLLVCGLTVTVPFMMNSFFAWSDKVAIGMSMSQPSVVSKGHLPNGETVIVRDYLDSYEWLEKNTKADDRVLAWWDYGYQITGIGRKISLADGNTWNQAHIALIGKMLTSTETEAHKMIRHMADYVLVWSGGGHDDLSKSGHLARIAHSNFPGHCGSDSTCQNFGFRGEVGQDPTPKMADSLLYKMCTYQMLPGVQLDPTLWEEVFKSKYMKVRIYKVKNVDLDTKAWLKDPANRLCDRPGSWYCPGQYPPAIWPFLPDHFLKGHRMELHPNNTRQRLE